jgi:inner membrane protein
MKKYITSFILAFKICILTVVLFGMLCLLFCILFFSWSEAWLLIPVTVLSMLAAIPVMILLGVIFPYFNNSMTNLHQKLTKIFAIMLFLITVYSLGGALLLNFLNFQNETGITGIFPTWLLLFVTLILSLFSAAVLLRKQLLRYFDINSFSTSNQSNSTIIMEQESGFLSQSQGAESSGMNGSNSILFKGIITAVLILLMMIPALFISKLVEERKDRQAQVVEEVSSKWASAQTLSGIYLVIPYTVTQKDEKEKITTFQKNLIILPEELQVSSQLSPEIRPRSIYNVLLYRAETKFNGKFIINIPKEIDPASVNLNEAKICMGVRDIKGIEEKLVVFINDSPIELSPGLPSKIIDEHGLSAVISLQPEQFGQPVSFSCSLKLKGSGSLHFIPMAGNSNFSIQSTWPNPSFDGNYLPGNRVVRDSGFQANWSFNKANLPFGTTLREEGFESDSFAFGITMVQPADQYAKTERSVKYAILFIGLTFSLFFIIELMQKNPVHPVQYVLIGVALCIFYTLLLSISEFMVFDLAYLIAATATILLITLYAKGHFRSWKTASIFGLVLSSLYAFTFVLVRLEDTALLIGSIGLFIVLALAMYASKNVNWYGRKYSMTE